MDIKVSCGRCCEGTVHDGNNNSIYVNSAVIEHSNRTLIEVLEDADTKKITDQLGSFCLHSQTYEATHSKIALN